MQTRFILIIILLLASCSREINDQHSVCKEFIKAVSTRDKELFYKITDTNLLKQKFQKEFERSSDIHIPFFIKYSPLKVHSDSLTIQRNNFEVHSNIRLKLLEFDSKINVYKYMVNWYSNDLDNEMILYLIKNGDNVKVCNVEWAKQ